MNDENLRNMTAAAQLIAYARHLVVFTGAGISTPSGIPDFRSQNSGLWKKDDPMQVASATVFKNHPGVFYKWLRPLLVASCNAVPNPAHLSLAQLEKGGIVKAVITQNIDGLHQKAGSLNVLELHGSLSQMGCPYCKHKVPDPSQHIEEILNGTLPKCRTCGGILKPGITLFEETLPIGAWRNAKNETRKADVMLIVGSSLEVVPASSLPYEAYQNGCKIIIINLTPTYLDARADLILAIDVAVGLPQILSEVEKLKEMAG